MRGRRMPHVARCSIRAATRFFVKLLYMQLCDRARRCGILAYSTLSSDEARTQMMTFHGKDFSSKVVLCNAQRKLPGQVVLIVLPVRAVERAAAECCFSQKKLFPVRRLHGPLRCVGDVGEESHTCKRLYLCDSHKLRHGRSGVLDPIAGAYKL